MAKLIDQPPVSQERPYRGKLLSWAKAYYRKVAHKSLMPYAQPDLIMVINSEGDPVEWGIPRRLKLEGDGIRRLAQAVNLPGMQFEQIDPLIVIGRICKRETKKESKEVNAN